MNMSMVPITVACLNGDCNQCPGKGTMAVGAKFQGGATVPTKDWPCCCPAPNCHLAKRRAASARAAQGGQKAPRWVEAASGAGAPPQTPARDAPHAPDATAGPGTACQR